MQYLRTTTSCRGSPLIDRHQPRTTSLTDHASHSLESLDAFGPLHFLRETGQRDGDHLFVMQIFDATPVGRVEPQRLDHVDIGVGQPRNVCPEIEVVNCAVRVDYMKTHLTIWFLRQAFPG